MYKEEMDVITHYKKSIELVNQLRGLSEDKWRTPIEEGKWTIAEIIGHLIPWDEFVLNQRIPYLFTKAQLPASPDAELVNQQAAKLSRCRSMEETIDLFIDRRNRLIKALSDLPREIWTKDLFVNRKNISLNLYFEGLIEHDVHHFKQIQGVY